MSAVYRVLIVEDEAHLAQGLRFNLEAEGYEVGVVGDGESALKTLQQPDHGFDIVVLDVMLPGKSGFDVARELRAAKQYVPILMLTARGRAEDVLHGFETGADDYLPKPFELPILVARISGLLRRAQWSKPATTEAARGIEPEDTFHFNGHVVDFNALEIRMHGRAPVRLTLMEAELLRHLIRNRGKAVSRNSILENVWGLREDTDTRAIDNFIVRLRRYIEDDPTKPKYLLTVRGVGYRFMPEPTEAAAG